MTISELIDALERVKDLEQRLTLLNGVPRKKQDEEYDNQYEEVRNELVCLKNLEVGKEVTW